MPISTPPITIRRTLGPGDAEAIVRLHARIYGTEYGLNAVFSEWVGQSVKAAIAAGWPVRDGAVWLIDSARRGERAVELDGALALTREHRPTLGRLRFFVLAPELRGRGLGRLMVGELLDEARSQGIERLELETFSELTTAAHIYRSVGFELTDSRQHDGFGAPIIFQQYVLPKVN
jgi:GNAT superfamily N-acetyltransferase